MRYQLTFCFCCHVHCRDKAKFISSPQSLFYVEWKHGSYMLLFNRSAVHKQWFVNCFIMQIAQKALWILSKASRHLSSKPAGGLLVFQFWWNCSGSNQKTPLFCQLIPFMPIFSTQYLHDNFSIHFFVHFYVYLWMLLLIMKKNIYHGLNCDPYLQI